MNISKGTRQGIQSTLDYLASHQVSEFDFSYLANQFRDMGDRIKELEAKVLPDFVPLKDDSVGWEAKLRIRRWVEQALIAKGAIFQGGGVCAEHSDIDVNIDGDLYNIRITPR